MIYRPANIYDGKAITKLNNKYYRAFLENDKQKGFLKTSFTLNQIESIIEAGEVVVAEFENQVIGYYLTNSIIETESNKAREFKVKGLIETGELGSARYVYQTQAVVEKQFMGNGVARELLKNLKKLVSPKFDYLIGYIDNENSNAKEAHLKSGWLIFADIEGGCLAMTKVTDS
jgi:hypothetical protein